MDDDGSGETHPLLTTREVAERFRVNPSTVRRWVEHKQLKASAVTIGGHYRFTEDDLAPLTGEITIQRPEDDE